MSDDLSRYRAMIQALAERALGMAVDASPHRPAPGQYMLSMTHALPCAKRLLGQPADLGPTAEQICKAADVIEPLIAAEKTPYGVVRFVDGRGHCRSVYGRLFLDLFDRVLDDSVTIPTGHQELLLNASINTRLTKDSNRFDPSLMLWACVQSVRGTEPALLEETVAQILEYVERVVGPPGQGLPLHEQTLEDSPDEWTYRELVGLHTLHALAELTGHEPWRQRVIEITNYHQDHTQPDYTTYQPWGLAAFLSNPETTWFAEQQLHDVETHLRVEGGPGALLPALLLADAAASVGMG